MKLEIVMNQLMFMEQVNVCKMIKTVPKEENVKKEFAMFHHQFVLIKELLDVKSLTHVLEE